MRGKWWIALGIGLLGWGLLELMLWQSELGDYARSPQSLRLSAGTVALVAGGRAGVLFEGSPYLRAAHLRIRCKGVDEAIRLRKGETSDELCGIRARLLELLPNDQASLEVTWSDDSRAAP
ncbi:MAG: hypothetical protein MI919_23510 [Holophagales bacterium]|nr:hypothetical protein [Holophagales bacterium]